MNIIYVIINFLLLCAILWFAGRKTIKNIFEGRRERIDRELDEAERLEKEAAEFVAAVPGAEPAELAEDGREAEEIRRRAEEDAAAIDADTERIMSGMRREMIAEVKEEMAKQLTVKVRRLLTEEPYLSKLKSSQGLFSDRILELIKLTPGDMAYLKSKSKLYVTLTSAYELDKEVVDKIDAKTRSLLEAVKGKSSFWVKEDPRLLGGFQLKVGDTVYACSVDDELYYLGSNLRKSMVSGEETAADLLEEARDLLKEISFDVRTYQRGRAITVSDGICWMDGLADIMYGEVVEFSNGERGMVLDIKQDLIGCIIYGNYEHIESGSVVRRVGRIARVQVGPELLGRVVDPLGKPIDGEGRIWTSERRPIELPAPGIPDRASVSRPMHTGLKAVDAMVPIGKGQRELIIGDRQTGKSAIAIDTIIAQKGKNTPCIYVAIGQKESTIAEIRDRLESCGAMEYTTIVSAPASSSASLQYIAPFAGTAMAEYFMYNGQDALIIYDDLSKHAVAYREISLLLHRPSGREAYPGDVFYLHSRLLERSAQLSEEKGGGSLTALPIIETQAGDISAYIPTNVISITDGQIFLESELFNEGQRPAVNVGLSVSRVGGAAQSALMKQTAASLRMKLAQYRELAGFAQFGAELDEASRATMDMGARLMAALRQRRYEPIPDWQEALILYAVQNGFANDLEPEQIADYEKDLFSHISLEAPEVAAMLQSGKKLDDKARKALDGALARMKGAAASA